MSADIGHGRGESTITRRPARRLWAPGFKSILPNETLSYNCRYKNRRIPATDTAGIAALGGAVAAVDKRRHSHAVQSLPA